MEKEEITQSIDFLNKQAKFLHDEIFEHRRNISNLEKNLKGVYTEISRVRRLCKKHTYIGQKQTCMGRGTCDICGESDY
jgi:uncharacterized coiled-coil DUF342 family protein